MASGHGETTRSEAESSAPRTRNVKLVVVASALVAIIAALGVVAAVASNGDDPVTDSSGMPELISYVVRRGDDLAQVAGIVAPGADVQTVVEHLAAANGLSIDAPIEAGDVLWYRADLVADFAASSGDDLPATTRTTYPTIAADGPSAVPGGAGPSVEGASFAATFNGVSELSAFRWGMHHRGDEILSMTEWQADHQLSGADCTSPDHTHTVHRSQPAESIYECTSVGGDPAKGHLMTAVGDTSPYSILWFAPNQTFTNETSVSWDVNLTDLGARQWWEVMITPIDDPDITCISYLPCGDDVQRYPDDAVIISTNDVEPRYFANGNGYENPSGWQTFCDSDEFSLDLEACNSRAIRRGFELIDNQNGTLSLVIRWAGVVKYNWTFDGSFPDEPWKVVFKDHSYTPNKSDGGCGGTCDSYTWHWDNIIIR